MIFCLVWFLQENKTRRSCCRRFVLLLFLGQREGQRAAHQGFFKGTQNFAFIYFFTLAQTHTRSHNTRTNLYHSLTLWKIQQKLFFG